ncbi:dipeptidase PepV [Terrilactibacillus laevilacticus]|uniref:Dipeptidase PepV n=1 Tax=Terrilactibacillus laevilacticus TaxID=1380157 RepID=A0ABW5PMS7_9BACI|nr:dipeptidase PepV [Terrilactibacillus laevilacticus]
MNKLNFTLNKDAFLKDLFDLLAIPSVKDVEHAKPGEPFGPEIARALGQLLELGEKEGFRTKNIDGYAGYIEYGPEEAEDYISILGHTDVVPATGNWTNPPFEPYVKDGKIYARGAIDDKGPTMAAFYGLKAVKDSGLPIKHRIRLVIGTDEESGCNCMKYYNTKEPMALFGFAPDAEFPLIYAEKGRIHTRLDYKVQQHGKDSDLVLVQFSSGERINMVPDQAYAVISGSRANDAVDKIKQALDNEQTVYSVEQVDDGWKVTVKGTSAHGSEPYGGVNAAFLLANGLKEAPFSDAEKPFISFLANTLNNDFYGENLGIPFKDDITDRLTVNAGIVRFDNSQGGSVSLDIRCPVTAPLDELIETLTSEVKKQGFEIGELIKNEPLYVDQKHPGVQILKKVYEENTGEKNVELLTSGGGTYAQYLDAGVAFGACFPGKPYTGHQVDEYIELDDLVLATSIYADAIYNLANMEK